jgi:hypothetical protein
MDNGDAAMSERRFHKGDLVRFRSTIDTREGVVKEDRGPIGVKGRHLYLVEYRRDLEDVSQVELPAEELELVQDTVARE